MRAYDVEDANQDVYKNGVCCFRQDTPPLGIGAFAHIHSAIEIIYVNTTRINRAERLLATTDKTVTEICSECGYNNVAYFIKVFKKYKSMPPMTYKRKEKYYDNQKSDKFRYGRAQ